MALPLFTLDKLLLQLSEKHFWTARHAVEGVQIFGGIGSGKTSGSGRYLALSYLKAGFGGLVLTVKPDEKKLWQEYCTITGREDDLIIVEPDGDHTFNFLDYESRENITDNIMQVLKTVIRASEEKSSGGADDQFWQDALDMLIFNVIDLCKLAYNKVELQTMYDIAQSLPNAESSHDRDEVSQFKQAYELAQKNISRQIDNWKQTLSWEEMAEISANHSALDSAAIRDLPDARTFRFVKQFFNETYRGLSEKTRSIVDFSFSGFLFRLLRDPIYSIFCQGKSTVTPDDCIQGKIILLNFPVKQYHKVGQDAQITVKYIWQRAMEKRKIHDDTLPVFLWADEAQNFLHEYDADYQATARSSRIATVYISQNLPNYYANMGGAKSDFKVKSFLGTLGTKFFHANADMETNKYASELIGDKAVIDISKNASFSEHSQFGHNRSLKFERAVRPEMFPSLKTGGKTNNMKSECFVHLQASDPHYFRLAFDQTFTLGNP
jgi:hypothetical protein